MTFVFRSAARQDILNQFLYLIDQGVPDAATRFMEAVNSSIVNLTSQPITHFLPPRH